MLLQRLCEYYDRSGDTCPAGYIGTRIRWLIDLDHTGEFLGFVATTEGKAGKKDRGKEFFVPHVARSSGVRAKLLADNGEYVLGIARETSDKERVAGCHAAFVEQVRKCAEATSERAVRAVLRFLDALPSKLPLPAGFDAADVITFRVDGMLPIELESVRAFWASGTGDDEDEETGKAKGEPMQCLVCGQTRPAEKRLAFKIKRIPGGQTSGTALISANQNAFESYGLEASLIAPTCRECGEKFSKAANALIQGDGTHISIGPLVYIFWTKGESVFRPALLLSRPEPDEVRTLIQAVFSGREGATQLDDTRFYASAFSASGARVAVRDWLETTVASARRNLARYFALQRIAETDGSEDRPFGLFALAASTVRDAGKDLPPNVPQALLHVALKGGPLPMSLLFQAVKRNRAEQRLTRSRAALIKMVLLSQHTQGKDEDMNELAQLNPNERNPAYLCGRLLAVLEAVQRTALPGINTSITDRFFGTASSAPASVFARLLRGAQPHLSKLRRDKRGAYVALDTRLQDILSNLGSFPKTLTLEEQGLFSLGYYHQRAADRAGAIAHKQARETAAGAETQAGNGR